jgi:glycosyltransferase involved in cell wall biosynthesis
MTLPAPFAPTISVIIPTYNAVERLKRTIQSVLDQTHAAHEVIVVDDGSTDQTPEIERLFGGDIRYVRTQNGGQQRARNLGAEMATGNWLALLDHDDLWEPSYLAEVDALVRAHPVDLTLCNSGTWSETGPGGTWTDRNRFTQYAPDGYWQKVGADPASRFSVLERYDFASYLRFHPSQTSMVSLSRELWMRLDGFDERMRGSGAENFEFEIRALRLARVGLIWEPLVRMVRHDANASLDTSRMAMDVVECLRFALANHGLDSREQAIAGAELQRRLPDAIAGAFTQRDFGSVRAYCREFNGTLSPKARLKRAVATLPDPVARMLASALRA